jgi:hypothetical protein
MGRESSHGAIREASHALRCPLCLSCSPTEVLEGAGGVFVQVRTFCYNALQATHLEGRHDHRRDDQEF